MKKPYLILLILSIFGLISCVKQKDCDCGLTGKFIYFEETEEIIYCASKQKVNALFIPEVSFPGYSSSFYYIIGSIPNKFKTKDTLNVTVCLKEKRPRDICFTEGVGAIYTLKCIEKED